MRKQTKTVLFRLFNFKNERLCSERHFQTLFMRDEASIRVGLHPSTMSRISKVYSAIRTISRPSTAQVMYARNFVQMAKAELKCEIVHILGNLLPLLPLANIAMPTAHIDSLYVMYVVCMIFMSRS